MYYRFSARVILFVALFASFAISQAPTRDPNDENKIVDELRKTASEETVAKFVAATEAMDSRRFDEAERLYQEVLKTAPEYDAALRRLGYTYISLGRRREGQDLTAKALAKNRSVENLISHAAAQLTSDDPQYRPNPTEIGQALTLAKEAWSKSGQKDEDSGAMVAEALLMAENYDEFVRFAGTFKANMPNSAAAAYYNAISLAERGELNAAEAEIDRAKALGVPDEAMAPLLAAINKARDDAFFGLGQYRGYLYPIAAIIALWTVGLVALFVIGRHLSKKTLASIESSDPNDVTGEAQASLKKLYRRIISIAGVYYYISQPFVIFLVIAFTGVVVLMFLWIGSVPVKIVLVLGFVGVVSIFYMIKSLVTRVKLEDPGRVLTEDEAPALWSLVRDVANTIQTQPVTEIRITHGTELAVYERGSFRAKMSEKAERILIIGTAVLKDFDQNAFRAVLAHEYGHFSNRDTAGGDIAHRVNNDIVRVAESMIASGTATFYNLGFQFLRLFHFLFRRITHGASRLQEVLADRVAAYHFGADAFREGLRHVIRRELEFSHVADKEVSAALDASRPISNLYELSVHDDATKGAIEVEFDRALEQSTSDDDTHPSPRDRFRFIEGAREAGAERLNGVVWDLFADRAAITAEMNDVIEKIVRPDWRSADA